jgi:hypothetical protein
MRLWHYRWDWVLPAPSSSDNTMTTILVTSLYPQLAFQEPPWRSCNFVNLAQVIVAGGVWIRSGLVRNWFVYLWTRLMLGFVLLTLPKGGSYSRISCIRHPDNQGPFIDLPRTEEVATPELEWKNYTPESFVDILVSWGMSKPDSTSQSQLKRSYPCRMWLHVYFQLLLEPSWKYQSSSIRQSQSK